MKSIFRVMLGILLVGVVACGVAADQHLGTARAELNPLAQVWYDGAVPSGLLDHFGHTTTAAAPSDCCDAIGCSVRTTIVSAWEEDEFQTDFPVNHGVYLGRACKGSTTAEDPRGKRLTDTDTGKPATWPMGTEMVIAGRPHLFKIGEPFFNVQGHTVDQWLTLVVLVGAPSMGGTIPTNVLIVLSTDGGTTWKNPHVLGVSSDGSGSLPGETAIRIVDVAGDVSYSTDGYWLNGFTMPLQLVWRTASGKLFYSFQEWDRTTEDLISHPTKFGNDRIEINASRMNPPGTPVPSINEMAVVTREYAPFFTTAIVGWPESKREALSCSGASTRDPITQTWHFMAIVNWATENWPMPAADYAVSSWPICVGGIDTGIAGNAPVYMNRGRPSAVFVPPSAGPHHDVIYIAVNQPRPNDPFGGTEIAVVEFAFSNSADPHSLTFSGVPVETPKLSADWNSESDQWMPTIVRNKTPSPSGTWIHLSWIDVAGSPTTLSQRNRPYGVFGTTWDTAMSPPAPTRVFPTGMVMPYEMSAGVSDFDLGVWNAAVLVDDSTHDFVDVLSDGRVPPPMPPPQTGIFSVESTP